MRTLLILLVLAGCGARAPDYPAMCRDAVRQGLVDPESARFEGEQYIGELEGRRVYVLTVNSKNRMGGYSGRRRMTCTFNAAGQLEGRPVDTTGR